MLRKDTRKSWFLVLCLAVLAGWQFGCGSEQIMVIEGDEDSVRDVASLEEEAARKTERLLEATNAARAVAQDCGSFGVMEPVPPVKRSTVLDEAAWVHAEDMVSHNFFSHEGSDGSRVTERVQSVRYEGIPVGENLAATFRGPEGVVQGWLDSESHCRILMSPHAVEVGFAVIDGDRDNDYDAYWVQVFGRPNE